MDLHLSISDGFVKTKIYDKRDDFDFDIVNFPFLDGDVPRSASYGVYISQLIRFARVSSHVDDFNTRNKVLTVKRPKAEPRARVGRLQTSSSPQCNYIAGRPKVALLFCFFSDFTLGVLLLIVLPVIHKYRNR